MELNRVLIVDDDPAIWRVVSALLDLDEYGLLEAADGQAALEVVKVERPDLVILDLTMPRLDGLRACQALRSDPELAGTRVLVLTGRDQPDDRAAARDAGADAYLVKPFSSLALPDATSSSWRSPSASRWSSPTRSTTSTRPSGPARPSWSGRWTACAGPTWT